VWQEEYEERLAEYEDADLAADPEEHRFDIPEGCCWQDVRKMSVDIGTILNTSFRAIEDANPRLKGVFQDVDFANKERFPDHLLDSPTPAFRDPLDAEGRCRLHGARRRL